MKDSEIDGAGMTALVLTLMLGIVLAIAWILSECMKVGRIVSNEGAQTDR